MIWLAKSDLRFLSAVLVFGLLIAGGPLSAGIGLGSHPKQPTFTLNICEPVRAAASGLSTIARPATGPPRLMLLEDGGVPNNQPKRLADLSDAPESPPPKAAS